MSIEKLPKGILWMLSICLSLLIFSVCAFVSVSAYEFFVGKPGTYGITTSLESIYTTLDKLSEVIQKKQLTRFIWFPINLIS